MICPKCKKEIPADSVFCCFCGKKLITEKNRKKRGNGEGTFFYNEKRKCWVGQKVIGVKPDGSPHRITRTGKTSKEVQAKIRAAIEESEKGKNLNPATVTVSDLGQKIIDDKFSLNLISETSKFRNEETLKIIANQNIGKMIVSNVTEQDVMTFHQIITSYSDSVIEKICGMLKRIFSEAIRMDLILKNPCEYIKRPKSEKTTRKIRALTATEQRKLLSVIDNCKYSTQLKLELFLGCRMGEINALQLGDIDFAEKTITIRKTITKLQHGEPVLSDRPKTFAGNRTLTLSDSIAQFLNEYIKNEYVDNPLKLLFVDKNQRFVTASQVNCAFKRLWEKYINPDDNVNQHMLRHTFATRCIESGMSAKVLQKLLGHEDISTTLNTYVDAFSEYERKHLDNTEKYLNENGLGIVSATVSATDIAI